MRVAGAVGEGAARGEVFSPARVFLPAVSAVAHPLARFVLWTLELSLLTPPVQIL